MASFQDVFSSKPKPVWESHVETNSFYCMEMPQAFNNKIKTKTKNSQSAFTGDLGALRSSSPARFHLLLCQCRRVCEQGHLAGGHFGIQRGVRANERLHQLRGGPHLLLRRAEERRRF